MPLRVSGVLPFGTFCLRNRFLSHLFPSPPHASPISLIPLPSFSSSSLATPHVPQFTFLLPSLTPPSPRHLAALKLPPSLADSTGKVSCEPLDQARLQSQPDPHRMRLADFLKEARRLCLDRDPREVLHTERADGGVLVADPAMRNKVCSSCIVCKITRFEKSCPDPTVYVLKYLTLVELSFICLFALCVVRADRERFG